MPETVMTEEMLEQLVTELDRVSDGFKRITAEILCNNPRFLLLLRLNTGLSQPEFENRLGLNKNLYKYESGKIRRMKLPTAERFLSVAEKAISVPRIRKNFKIFSANSRGWFKANSLSVLASKARQKGAAASMRLRSTTQEQHLAGLLRKRGLRVEINKPLSEKIIADIVVSKPFTVIECKRLETFNRRQQTKKIRELAYQGYKLKFAVKNARIFAFIQARLPLQPSDFEELQGPFDKVILDLKQFNSFF